MRDKLNLVIQSFGREQEYFRAILSIWSFYAHASPEYENTNVLLFSDRPQFFQDYLKDLPVTYVQLTPASVKQMRGEIDFLHRIKIGIIEEAFQRSQGDLLYLDADTFFTADPAPLFENLSQKISFMHVNEYAFQALGEMPLPSGAPFHSVLKAIREKEFTMANGRNKRFDPSLFSWNAGVIMLHRAHQILLPDVYAITDQLYFATNNHASEQYAFSMVLQTNTELHACDKIIHHYWYRIKKQIADDFLAAKMNYTWRTLSREEKKRQVKAWTKKLPSYFEQHLLTRRDNAVQAFNRNDFSQGYLWTFKAFVINPFNFPFLKDCIYHTKRFFAQL
jgi:primosomal protein N''